MSACRLLVVTFRFRIGQQVKLPTGDKGEVIGRADYGNKTQYQVIWWADGKRNDEWLREFELQEAE